MLGFSHLMCIMSMGIFSSSAKKLFTFRVNFLTNVKHYAIIQAMLSAKCSNNKLQRRFPYEKSHAFPPPEGRLLWLRCFLAFVLILSLLASVLPMSLAAAELQSEQMMEEQGQQVMNSTSASTTALASFATGNYYVNNLNTGRFALRSSSGSGVTAVFTGANAQRWTITHLGNGVHTLQNVETPSLYLGIAVSTACGALPYAALVTNTGLPSATPNTLRWKIVALGNGNFTLQSVSYGLFLNTNSSALTVTSTATSNSSWRIQSVGGYTNLANFTVHDMALSLEQTKTLNITPSLVNNVAPTWSAASDFELSVGFSARSPANINHFTNQITGRLPGKDTVTIQHKPTGVSKMITVDVYGVVRFQNNSFSDYLNADAGTTANTYNINRDSNTNNKNSGNQLWTLSYLNNGYYKIVNLGHRTSDRGATDEFLLTAGSNGTSVNLTAADKTLTTTLPHSQQWLIWFSGSSLYFQNRQHGTVLVPHNSNNSVVLNNSTGNERLWTMSSVLLWDVFDGGYVGVTKPITINLSVESSATIGRLTMADVYNHATAWNGIIHNITVNVFEASITPNPPPADITIPVRGVNIPPDPDGLLFLGEARPIINGVNGNLPIAGPNEIQVHANWNGAVIVINTNSNFIGSNSGFTTEDLRMNFLHEVGHALKLAHPAYFDRTVVSIMNTGVPSQNANVAATPTQHDMQTLKSKWE